MHPPLEICLYTHINTHTEWKIFQIQGHKGNRVMKEMLYRKWGFRENSPTTRQWQLIPFYLNVFSQFLHQVHLLFNSRVADSFLERLKNQGRKITGNFVLSIPYEKYENSGSSYNEGHQLICLSEVAQSCLTLQPRDCSLPGSFIHGVFQARVLEWVAISSSGDLPSPRIEPRSPVLQADTLPSEPPGKSKYALHPDKEF